MAQDLKTQIISYGMKNKKSEREILQAMIDSGQIDIPDAAAAIKSAKEAGVFDYANTSTSDPMKVDHSKLNVTQNSDYGFGSRMLESGKVISGLESGIAGKGIADSLGQYIDEKQVGGTLTNRFVSPEFQSFDQAKRDFINAKLRKESGAVISQEEFDNAAKQYFPVPGDDVATVEQKRKNREQVTKDLLASGGVDTTKLDISTGKPVQAAAQVAPGFQEAMQFAQANPNDPRSVGLKKMIDSGQIDPNTGQKITAQQAPAPAASPMAPEAPTAPVTPETDTLTSRLWNATKEVIPGLTEDIGNRLKNIWSNTAAGTEANANGEYNQSVGSTVLQNVGEVAGGVGDAASRVLELVYKTGVTNENQDKVKAAANEFLTTDTGKAAVDALKGGIEAWDGFKQSNPTEAKNMEAVMNILTAIPAGKGLGVAGSAAKEAKNIAGDTVRLAGTALKAGENGIASTIAKESKDVTRAIKPALSTRRDKRAFSKTLETANQRIIDDGYQPTDLQSYADSLRDSKKKVWGEVETALKSVGDDTKVDLIPIATALRDMAKSPAMLRADPKAAAKVKSLALNLVKNGKKISVQDAEDLKQFINAELSGTFGKFNLSDTEINSKKLVTDLIGKQLDEKLSKIPGEFSNLKSTYGALKQTEDDVLKRLIVHGRQNPESLVDSMAKISGVGNIIESIANVQFGSALKGVAQMAVGKIQKNANDADLIIKKAFEAMNKGKGGFVPKSKTGQMIQNSIKEPSLKGSPTVGETAMKEAPKMEMIDNTPNTKIKFSDRLDEGMRQMNSEEMLVDANKLSYPDFVKKYEAYNLDGGGLSSGDKPAHAVVSKDNLKPSEYDDWKEMTDNKSGKTNKYDKEMGVKLAGDYYKKSFSPPLVTKVDGEYVTIDGHHRIANLMSEGQDQIPVYFDKNTLKKIWEKGSGEKVSNQDVRSTYERLFPKMDIKPSNQANKIKK